MEGDTEDAAIGMMSDNTARLTSAVRYKCSCIPYNNDYIINFEIIACRCTFELICNPTRSKPSFKLKFMRHKNNLCSSLPELLEKKRLIDMHTNIATAMLEHIKVSNSH